MLRESNKIDILLANFRARLMSLTNVQFFSLSPPYQMSSSFVNGLFEIKFAEFIVAPDYIVTFGFGRRAQIVARMPKILHVSRIAWTIQNYANEKYRSGKKVEEEEETV